jgi:transposase
MSTDAPLTLDPAALPDDPALLKQFFLTREQQLIADRDRRLAEFSELIARIKDEAARQMEVERERHAAELKAAIQALLRRYYGPRSESFDARQLLLFGQIVEQMPLDEQSIEDEAGEKLTTRRAKNRHKHGRRQLSDELERIEIEHDLKPEEKPCPACGHERSRIGAEVAEQLEYFPANFKVLKHVRHKYGCAKCNAEGYNPNIAAASKPAQPIDKGLAGPSLLAYVITSKLGDHLPLYRLENIFARQECRWPAARCVRGCWRRANWSSRWWNCWRRG